MYSVVLMAALTTGTSAPAGWCHHSHGHGYYGGYDCYAASNCYGVYGGSYYGIPGGGYGGYGGGYGGYGVAYGFGGYGGYGGGGYGMGYGGGYGCYGGSWGGGAVDYNCFGCHGCYGCAGAFGCYGFNPYGPPPNAPEQIPPPKVDENKKPGGMGAVTPDRAKVVVQLPTDAKLFVDDQPIKATTERQTFNTPKLERGQTYFYDVRAEVVRDGKTVVENQRILVRAGDEVTVSFPKLTPPTADVAKADAPRGR
jgi:uncharacterized protein (TIGR03000 family)